jgi:virulence-associated protein VapD
MFAIAFDLTVAEVLRRHPRNVAAAYDEIGRVLSKFQFEWKQGSLYVTNSEDLANLMLAMNALKALPWFSASVRDIRAFRVEQWSDFTGFMKTT